MAAASVSPAVREQLLRVFSILDRSGSQQIDQRGVGFLLNKLFNRNMDEMSLAEVMLAMARRLASSEYAAAAATCDGGMEEAQ